MHFLVDNSSAAAYYKQHGKQAIKRVYLYWGYVCVCHSINVDFIYYHQHQHGARPSLSTSEAPMTM